MGHCCIFSLLQKIIMSCPHLTQETESHTTIVVINVDYSELEISRFLKVAQSFVYKVCKELETKGGNYHQYQA